MMNIRNSECLQEVFCFKALEVLPWSVLEVLVSWCGNFGTVKRFVVNMGFKWKWNI